MDSKRARIDKAKKAKNLAQRNLDLAKKLYKDGKYYDWTIVVLFYSACAISTSICHLKKQPVPEIHKGYYSRKSKKYIEGHLDKVQKHLSRQSYECYSNLLIYSQLFRYNADYIFMFQNNPGTSKMVEKFFKTYKVIIDDFKKKYERFFS